MSEILFILGRPGPDSLVILLGRVLRVVFKFTNRRSTVQSLVQNSARRTEPCSRPCADICHRDDRSLASVALIGCDPGRAIPAQRLILTSFPL